MKSLLGNLQLYFGNNGVMYAEMRNRQAAHKCLVPDRAGPGQVSYLTWVMLGPYQVPVWGRQSPCLGNPTKSQVQTLLGLLVTVVLFLSSTEVEEP